MATATGMKDKLKVRNVRVVTASGNVTMVNEGILVLTKSTPATTTVTLTPSPERGDHVTIKDGNGDAATYAITVQAASGNIDGSSTYTINENYGAATFVYNGTQWNVAGEKNALSATELAFLNGVTAGTAAASKALVLDSSSNITGVGRLGVDGIRYEDVGTIAAAGSAIGDATAITNRVTYVTGADDTKGVKLPTAVAGDEYIVYQTHATAGLKVYPHVNGDINDGTANAAIVIEGKTMARFIALDTTTWAASYTANA